MNVQRLGLLSAIALGAASPLVAQSLVFGNQPRVADQQRQGIELFEWDGRVDREIQVVMRGNNLWTNPVGQTESPRARTRTYSRLPNQDGQVIVRVLNGRGNVDVVQQPNRQNNYTTIVRLVDGRSGSDEYRLVAYWQGYANGDVYGGGSSNMNNGRAVGRNRDRNNNGIDDRDERRRGRDDRDDDDDRDEDRRGRDVYNSRRSSDNEALHWSGNVDDDLEISIQNGRVSYRTLRGSQPTNVRANPGTANISRLGGNLAISQASGRGSVQIVQQPSQWNGYTTVIRVRDPQSGSSWYDFSVIAQ